MRHPCETRHHFCQVSATEMQHRPPQVHRPRCILPQPYAESTQQADHLRAFRRRDIQLARRIRGFSESLR